MVDYKIGKIFFDELLPMKWMKEKTYAPNRLTGSIGNVPDSQPVVMQGSTWFAGLRLSFSNSCKPCQPCQKHTLTR